MHKILFILMLVVTELFNIAVNDSDTKKADHYRRVLVITKLVVSGTQCKFPQLKALYNIYLNSKSSTIEYFRNCLNLFIII